MASQQAMYEVLWPRGRKTISTGRLAKRLDTLEGKTICEVSNRSFHSNETFPFIEKELTRRYPGIKFVGYEEFGSTRTGDAKTLAVLADKLKQNKVDAVICGVGC